MSISEVLSEISAKAVSLPPGKFACPACKDEGFIHGEREEGGQIYSCVRFCKCQAGERQLFRIKGIQDVERPTLETKKAHQKGARLGLAKSYQDGERGVLLFGNTGTGKTAFLRRAMAHYTSKHIRAAFWLWDEVVQQAQESYKDKNPEWGLSGLISELSTIPVLFLDDVGAGGSENLTFLERIFARALNARIDNGLKTYASTNLDPFDEGNGLSSRIGDRLCSRLHSLCEIVDMCGPDLRRNENYCRKK